MGTPNFGKSPNWNQKTSHEGLELCRDQASGHIKELAPGVGADNSGGMTHGVQGLGF